MAEEFDSAFWLPDEFLDDDFFSSDEKAAVAAARSDSSDEDELLLGGLSRRMAGLDCDGGTIVPKVGLIFGFAGFWLCFFPLVSVCLDASDWFLLCCVARAL